MNFGRFWSYINYSYMPPEDIHVGRWYAMLRQWLVNQQLASTFTYFHRPDDESPDSYWDYEFAKSSRRRGERRSFFQNATLTEIEL